MPIATGSRLGPYEILAPIGAGGMGEVYRAKDTRLERTVAVKVLPQRLSSSPEGRQRFEREAKTISQLSHPHICALYDVGREGETEYLVMELLEGETLSDRLAKGPLPLEQTLRYGIEIAGALDKAHRQGIAHRDLKPGNVMLTKSGVKLLDFGLAKVVEPAASPSSVTSLPTQQGLTQEGTILGTFQYMAPEQLEGKPIDARTDIWALGCVLYEMATGRKAFSGSSQASLISSIMTSEPAAISTLAPLSPQALDRVVRSCVAKDPEDRWQSAGDVAKELRWISEGSAAGVAAAAAPAARRKARERLAWLAALLAVAAASALMSAWFLARPAPPSASVRFDVLPPAGGEFLSAGWLSPDGRSLAFSAPDNSGTQRIWIRALDSVEARPVEGTGDVSDLLSLAWSPDGRSFAVAAEHRIKRIAIADGSAQPVCATQTTFGLSWGAAGALVFVPGYGSGVMQVPASGGTPSAVTSVDRPGGEVAHLWPRFLPDGRRFLFFARTRAGRESQQGWITSASLDAKGTRRIRAADGFVGVAEGQLLFILSGTLYAQPFDPKTLAVRGEPAVIAGRPFVDGSNLNSLADAAGPTLVFRSDPPKLRRLVWMDRGGRKLSEVGAPEAYRERLAISPDGRLALVGRREPQRGVNQLLLLDLARGTAARSGSGVEEESYPVWSPDGQRFLLDWDREGPYDLVIRRLDGSSADEVVLRSEFDKVAQDWSRDGKVILFRDYDPRQPGLGILPLGSKDPPSHVAGSERADGFRLSPDGRWILWTSAESGRREVYVQRFPDGSARQQVSVGGGASARWRPDGREIFFVSPDAKLTAASVDSSEGSLRMSIPAPLFPVSRAQMEDAYTGAKALNWDVSPDGSKFL
ncbi:MAG: protein kinase domain-containing protein, partial [Acidobacteriota bacterium]